MSRHAYIHGYLPEEQQRLVGQAAFWRERIILPGTAYGPGTRLLEVGCGVAAVLAELGAAFPGLRMTGVDREGRQLRCAKAHLAARGLKARLLRADALSLPLAGASFDAAFDMWFLEHVPDPLAALQEVRRVLAPGGLFTGIEVDYRLIRPRPSTPALEHFLGAFRALFNLSGRSDAGEAMAGWLTQAGFRAVRSVPFLFEMGTEAEIEYLLGFMEPGIPAMAARLPWADPALLRRGADEFRRLAGREGAGVGVTVHKAWARKD